MDPKRGEGANQDINTTPPALRNRRQVIGDFAFLDDEQAISLGLSSAGFLNLCIKLFYAHIPMLNRCAVRVVGLV
jgi:hypothetical protein